MKKFSNIILVSIIILVVFSIFSHFGRVAKLTLNLGKNYAVFEKTEEAADKWNPKNPGVHYNRQLKIYKQYSPGLFSLHEVMVDTISNQIVVRE